MTGGLAALAGRRLFEPLAPWITRLPAERLPTLEELNAVLGGDPAVRLGDGRPLRCVPPHPADPRGYEARILETGEIPTRPGDRHDCFNALVWRAFPAAKAALNRRHGEALAGSEGNGRRGRVRDALTQFDECGILVTAADLSLCEGLAAHRWDEVFRGRRAEVRAGMDFLVFGHGSYDQLRTPFHGLCGKAVYRQVAPAWFGLSPAARVEEADRWLAAWIAGHLAAPAQLSPLPVLGIPGVTDASEAAAFYLDASQFRPMRAGRGAAPCWGAI